MQKKKKEKKSQLSLAISVPRENSCQHTVIDPSSLFLYKFIIICYPLTFCLDSVLSG